jgi:uncharacterized protein YegL
MRRLVIAILCAAVVFSLATTAFGKLSDEQFNELKKRIKAGAGKNPKGVKDNITDIAKDDSRRAVAVLVNINRKALDDMDVVAVIQSAISSMRSDEARSAIIASVPKASDYRMRIILIEVCLNFSGSEVARAISSCLSDRKDKVAITAARTLGEKGSLEAVEPLIVQMEKLAKKKQSGTRLYCDIRRALERITGQSDLIEAQDWRNWYNANKDKIVPGAPGADGRVGTYKPVAGEAKTVSFFGIQIDSRKIIFVIDVSGSMIIPDPPPENWVPDKDIGKGKGTTLDKDDPTLKKKLKKERDRMKDRKVWEKERQRIVRTKKELIRVLKALQGTVKFNIISFSDEINSFAKGLQKATASTRSKAVKWVEKLSADGLTFTDDALKEAFKDGRKYPGKKEASAGRNGKGPRTSSKDRSISKSSSGEADTIILLSDGAPTHAGGDAKPEWNGHQDSQLIIKQIFSWLEKENKFRKIVIHTLGFSGANFEFMQELAKKTGGTFREIK